MPTAVLWRCWPRLQARYARWICASWLWRCIARDETVRQLAALTTLKAAVNALRWKERSQTCSTAASRNGCFGSRQQTTLIMRRIQRELCYHQGNSSDQVSCRKPLTSTPIFLRGAQTVSYYKWRRTWVQQPLGSVSLP